MAELAEPKKPLTAYFLYINAVRPKIAKELGSAALGPLAKVAGERWKSLPANEKAVYEKQAEEKKTEYNEAMKAFKESGGEVGKKRKEKRDAKDKRDAKRARKEQNAGKPKRPAGGAYGVYITMHREEIMKSLPSGSKCTEVSKVAGKRFKALSEKERSVYEAKYQEKKAKFDEEIKAWKATQGPAAGDDEEDDEDDDEEEEDKKEAKTDTSKEPALVLPAKVAAAAAAMGEAYAGGPYTALLLKLLATPGLGEKVAPEAALEALRKNNGNVNRTRNVLRAAGA